MCGIAFAISRKPINSFILEANKIQKHRGPDCQEALFEKHGEVNLGFSHQRLSILDLSSRGAQPMTSRSGQSTIVFNGEIYNYRDLASKYSLSNLMTGTDTEVALELIEKIGFDSACKEFNGMWAMVVYDRKKREILISRDRFGKKPLNYLIHEGAIYIASELKTFYAVEGFSRRVNVISASRYLTQSLQNIDENTWMEGIKSFPPAQIGVIDLKSPDLSVKELGSYWNSSIEESESLLMTLSDYPSELRCLVEDATNIRLHADVPVGVALSGGIDSSILAALAVKAPLSNEPITMFSAVSPGSKEDESEFIDIVAKHLNINVEKFSLQVGSGNELFDLIGKCNYHNDGPVSSFSNILFYKLMEMASRSGVKVILTGQGADEAFCGYRKYPALEVRRLLKAGRYIEAAKFLSGFIFRGTLLPQLKFAELKRYLGATNSKILGHAATEAINLESIGALMASASDIQRLDLERYSVPYLCHYEDRMSMAFSREIRSPFLDYRVIELGLKMPTDVKLRSGWTKYVLRKAFQDILPREITWRKDKKGFVNPQDDWLKKSLRGHVMDVMGDKSLSIYKEGLVNRDAYLRSYRSYCNGNKTIWFRDVFAPFSLAIWLESLGGQ